MRRARGRVSATFFLLNTPCVSSAYYLPVRAFQRSNQSIESRCLKFVSYIEKITKGVWTIYIRSPTEEKDLYTPPRYFHHRL